MESSTNRLPEFKFTPILNKIYNPSKHPRSSERFKFKKTLSIEKPEMFFHSAYSNKHSKIRKKPLVIEPKNRNHQIIINKPVLGRNPISSKRSASVVPERHMKHPKINIVKKLMFPVLSLKHQTPVE